MLQPALLGGLFIGVLSGLPVVNIANYCCCMWIVTGGMLAAYLDQAPGRPNNLPRGALDGLLAGVVGAVVYVIVVSAVNVVIAPIQQRIIEGVLAGAYDMPPEIRSWLEMARDTGGEFFWNFVSFVFHLFAGITFGTLGGLLGALFFWRDGLPPALGGPQPPPPIPPQM